MALLLYRTPDILEAGCDEAGRGCLAGPVTAAAVILPPDFSNNQLDDSKKLTEKQRLALRPIIESQALAWAVATVSPEEIDAINILNASFLAMHRALDLLDLVPDELLIDGNRFKQYGVLPHHCMVKGDGRFLSIAAASVLAKTYRDEEMERLSEIYPNYGWRSNKGYPTKTHRAAIAKYGITPLHRKSFNLNPQLDLFED